MKLRTRVTPLVRVREDDLRAAIQCAPLSQMRDLLRPDGVLVTVTGESERMDDRESRRRTVSFIVQTSGELLAAWRG